MSQTAAAGSGQKAPNIEALHRDLAFANTYRLEFIKTGLLLAGGLFAFSVSFRPALTVVEHSNLYWASWLGLAISMAGGLSQLFAWDRFYASYQQYEWKNKDGDGYRRVVTRWRRLALALQVIGFLVGVFSLGAFTTLNIAHIKATPTATTSIAKEFRSQRG